MLPQEYMALVAAAPLFGCMTEAWSTGSAPVSAVAEVRTISLPGAPATGVTMDYLAYDRSHHRVWVPAGNSWPASCGEGGPKGLAVDRSLNFLFLACSDQVKLFDAGHGGKELSAIATGAGVDDIAYLEAHRELYVGAAKAAKLIIASVDVQGRLEVEAAVPTAPGVRNAVVTDDGVAYLTDSPEGKLLVVSPRVRR